MMRSFLRQEFENGHAIFYIIAAAPFSLMVSFVFPGPIIPFVQAAFAFPVFFFFVRRGAYSKTFWMMAAWAVFQMAVVGGLAAIEPEFMAEKLYGWKGAEWFSLPPISEESLASLAVWRALKLVMIGAFAAISGGAFALVAGAIAINGAAFTAGGLLAKGKGWAAAMMLLEPWSLSYLTGAALAAVGVSAFFYMVLERRPLEKFKPVRIAILGVAFVALGVYLEFSLGPVWRSAVASALR